MYWGFNKAGALHAPALLYLVRKRGFEPPRLSALPPQGSESTVSPPALFCIFFAVYVLPPVLF